MPTGNRYATGTTVPVSRSQEQLKSLVKKYGASAFVTGELEEPRPVCFVLFNVESRPYRLTCENPDRSEFARTPTGKVRTERQVEEHWDREVKRRWRSLVHVVKGILVGVDEGLFSFEEAMAMHRVLHSGRTMREEFGGQLDQIAATGELPPLLLPPAGSETVEGYWQIIVSIAGIAVSAAAVWFTWLNTKQANQAHKLAMYDRRMKVYNIVFQTRQSLWDGSQMPFDDLVSLEEELTKGALLFPEVLRSHLLDTQMNIMAFNLRKFNRLPGQSDQEERAEDMKDIQKKIGALLTDMEKEIAPAESLLKFRSLKKMKAAIDRNKAEIKL